MFGRDIRNEQRGAYGEPTHIATREKVLGRGAFFSREVQADRENNDEVDRDDDDVYRRQFTMQAGCVHQFLRSMQGNNGSRTAVREADRQCLPGFVPGEVADWFAINIDGLRTAFHSEDQQLQLLEPRREGSFRLADTDRQAGCRVASDGEARENTFLVV